MTNNTVTDPFPRPNDKGPDVFPPTATHAELPRGINDDVRDEALRLAMRGIKSVICYGLLGNENGMRCTCREGERCRSPGKHPIAMGGHKAATSDAEELKRELSGQPIPRNLAICTGETNGLVVLDCDYRSGGLFALRKLQQEHGPLPKTVTAHTGNGVHFYYKLPAGSSIKSRPFKGYRGLDVKADGGMVIAPPSRHKNGKDYRWEHGASIHHAEPAELPAHLLALFQQEALTKIGASSRSLAEDGEVIEEGGRHDFLVREAGRLRRRGLEYEPIKRRLLQLNENRCSPPLEEDEVLRIAKDISEKAAGPLTQRHAPALLRIANEGCSWQTALLQTEKGILVSNIANVVTILGNDAPWEDVLVFDEFAHCVEKAVPPPWHEHDKPSICSADDGPWRDEDTSRTSAWLAREYGIKASPEIVHRAVKLVAERSPVHPIRTYLEALSWDGTPRVETWLLAYLGAHDSPYARLVGQWWLISAVARIMRPGCKVDHVLILEGPQGQKKSTALRVLAGDKYFVDTAFDVGNKDAYLQIRKAWIVELAELSTLSRAEAARAKAFFTSSTDTYRPPYGHEVVAVPRQQVFAGTVNEEEYLKDDTGNRRYWPVMVGAVDIDALVHDRNQLWAEAVEMWRNEEKWYPTSAIEDQLCQVEQDKRLIVDPWRPLIERWLFDTRSLSPSTLDVLTSALGVNPSAVNRTQSIRVGNILRQLGGKRRQMRRQDGQRVWVYDIPSALIARPPSLMASMTS
jgi:predicted P-loop ATPase